MTHASKQQAYIVAAALQKIFVLPNLSTAKQQVALSAVQAAQSKSIIWPR